MTIRTKILGTGRYLPERVVTNNDLTEFMETSDEWIQQRTGIKERRWIAEETGTSDLAFEASKKALEAAKLQPGDIDAIIFATLSPDYTFPGSGCLLNALLDIPGVPALDIRNQCSGFIYGTQVADSWIRSGLYKNVLMVGAEIHSSGLDMSTRGRDVSVIFGDGAGAVIFGPTDAANDASGVLSTRVGADGRYAKELTVDLPGSKYLPRTANADNNDPRWFPTMNGREVFKHASRKMPKILLEALGDAGLGAKDIDLLIPHQANLRISEAVQKILELPSDKVYNNIQKYGNTTAASIPIALDECIREGRLKRGDLLATAAFGAGFTWGSAVIRY